MKCNKCGNEFEKLGSDLKRTNLYGYCSDKCYRTSNDYIKERTKFLTSFLIGKNVFREDMTLDDMKVEYSKLQRELYSVTKEKKINTTIERYGSVNLCCVAAGNRSKYNKSKKYLLENKIVESIEGMSDEYILSLYNSTFYKNTNHSEKIKKSLSRFKDIKSEFRRRASLSALRYFKLDENVLYTKQFISELITKYKNAIGFFVKDTNEWKISHLKNIGVYIDGMNRHEVSKAYSKYISDRYNSRSLEVENNGYKRTKKGWYAFENIDSKMFYMSSWEKDVMIFLDSMISEYGITNICCPKRIKYEFGDNIKHYYPDISIFCDDKEYVLEIKPSRKVSEEQNKSKFVGAQKQIANFFIVTEKEIYDNDIKDYFDRMLK